MNWNLKDSKLQKFGYGLCSRDIAPFSRACHYSPHHTCQKFSPAPAAAINKRKAFLK